MSQKGAGPQIIVSASTLSSGARARFTEWVDLMPAVIRGLALTDPASATLFRAPLAAVTVLARCARGQAFASTARVTHRGKAGDDDHKNGYLAQKIRH